MNQCQRALCGSIPNRNQILMDIPSPFPYQSTVGIDWADEKHDVFVRFANGDCYQRKIDSRSGGIQEFRHRRSLLDLAIKAELKLISTLRRSGY
jgi:hypothetical protein